MLQVKCYTCCVIVFFSFTSTDSRTATQEEIPGAKSPRAADNTYRSYSKMQAAVRRSTEYDDWEVARIRIINATLNRLSNASSVEDILNSGLTDSSGNPLTPQDISAAYDDTGKLYIATESGVQAEKGQCEPRQLTMVVQVPGMPANVVLYPKCIKVWRCDGCCNVENVVCVPAAEKRTIYNLMKLTMERGDNHMQFSGYHQLEVMEPTGCLCGCSLSQDSCGPRKTFDDTICACRCNSASANLRCLPPTYFNPETCSCECAERSSCCSVGSRCGMAFNETSCSCEFQEIMYISHSTNQTQGQAMDDSSRIVGGSMTRQPPSIPVFLNTTGSLTSDPCAVYICPRNFQRTVDAQGRCACAPIRRPGRR